MKTMIEELLQKIKFVLSCGNEAQARRHIEQFIHYQEELTIEFSDWMAKEYWLNPSGEYTQGQTHKVLYEIFKRERSISEA